MKFKEYLEYLNDIAKKHPSSLEMDVIYSRDDTGNGHSMVCCTPSIGLFRVTNNGRNYIEEYHVTVDTLNCVCIN